MERSAYFRIGLFVIIAVVLGVAGVVVLGGGKFFEEKNIIETYIDESVQGLDAGSPVKFRGVLVGNVEEITLSSVEYPTRRSYVVVRAGISRNVFRFPLNDPANAAFIAEVQRGLRVRLAPQGLTGQAYLEADYLNPNLNPPLPVDWSPKYPYVPSARSRITQLSDAVERILRNMEQVDIQRLVGSMDNALKTIDKLASGANLDKVTTQAVTLLAELRDTNRQLKDLVSGPELKSAAKDAAAATASAREIFQRAEKPLNQLINDLPKMTESVNRVVQRLDAVSANLPETSADLRQTLQNLNRLITSQQQDIERTVENLRVTSEAVRQFVETSRKYPAQTLFGAPPPPAKAMSK